MLQRKDTTMVSAIKDFLPHHQYPFYQPRPEKSAEAA